MQIVSLFLFPPILLLAHFLIIAHKHISKPSRPDETDHIGAVSSRSSIFSTSVTLNIELYEQVTAKCSMLTLQHAHTEAFCNARMLH